MKPNLKHHEMKICVESIHKGVSWEIRYAQFLRKEFFDTNEEFRVYFGLKPDAPVMSIVCGEEFD